MQLTDEQFERIARWLDGEQVELTADEEKLAVQFRDHEALAADMLEAELPAEALAVARLSINRELTCVDRQNVWFKFAAPAAVAAVVLLSISAAFIVLSRSGQVDHIDPAAETIALADEDQLLKILIETDSELWGAEFDQLEDQLLMASLGVYDDAELDWLDRQLDDLSLDTILDNSSESLLK